MERSEFELIPNDVKNLVELFTYAFEVGALDKSGLHKEAYTGIIAARNDGEQRPEVIGSGILNEAL